MHAISRNIRPYAFKSFYPLNRPGRPHQHNRNIIRLPFILSGKYQTQGPNEITNGAQNYGQKKQAYIPDLLLKAECPCLKFAPISYYKGAIKINGDIKKIGDTFVRL